jgi:hypothetical protein
VRRCEALKGDGSRCKARAMEGYQWCFNHRPDLAETRRRNAQRAGQAGGRGRPGAGASAELATVKAELRDVIADVRDGSLDRGTGAVIGGLYNTLLRALEVQRRWYEADVLEARIEALEAEREQEQGGSRWRA